MRREREGESTRRGVGVFIYGKASQIEKWAVSLHNWTGYFYTLLTSWAACWHVYPYFSQIFSVIRFHYLPMPSPSLLYTCTLPSSISNASISHSSLFHLLLHSPDSLQFTLIVFPLHLFTNIIDLCFRASYSEKRLIGHVSFFHVTKTNHFVLIKFQLLSHPNLLVLILKGKVNWIWTWT